MKTSRAISRRRTTAISHLEKAETFRSRADQLETFLYTLDTTGSARLNETNWNLLMAADVDVSQAATVLEGLHLAHECYKKETARQLRLGRTAAGALIRREPSKTQPPK
jgi:hypothetical protein